MSKYSKFTFRGLLAGAFIALFALAGGFVLNNKPLEAQSARDCDSNAIIYCGANTVSELMTKYNQNSTKDLPAIFSAFGISPSKLQTQVALGQVHKDGSVWLNGQKIGDNALTAGRHYKAGSTAVAGVWARSPRVSFAASSIDAFIGFENGKPAWAILSACGNPVKWDRPNVSVDKKVAATATSAWVEDATYANNTEATYMITVKNTGNASDTNVTVMDRLPAYQTYVPGSTKTNNVADRDGITTTGLNLGTLKAGQTAYITFRAKISVPTNKCGLTDMVNTVRQDSDKGGPHEDTATTRTSVTCITMSCDAITGLDSINLGENATYKVSASATGTTISQYIFSVNGTVAQTSASDTFTIKPTVAGSIKVSAVVKFANGATATGNGKCEKTLTVKDIAKSVKCESLSGPTELLAGQSGTFTATASDASLVASYSFKVNGQAVTANANVLNYTFTTPGTYTIEAKVTPKAGVTDGGSANCVKTVKVKELPKTPVYKCDLLTVTPSTVKVGGKVTATASYTALNGAAFKNATFNFGEGNPVVVTTANNVSAEYSYTKAGNKTVTVTFVFTVDGKDVTVEAAGDCVKKVTVTEEPVLATRCDALDANKSAIKLGETINFTAKATAVNTTITEYIFSVNGAVVQTSAKNTFDFKPTAKGDYNVTVSVKFANGDVRGGEGACAKKVTVTVDTPPVCELNPSLPKDDPKCKPVVEIPNTGAGSVIGAFAGVTVAGAFMHNLLARRSVRD